MQKTQILTIAVLAAFSVLGTGCIETALVAGGGALAYNAWETRGQVKELQNNDRMQDRRLEGLTDGWNSHEKELYEARRASAATLSIPEHGKSQKATYRRLTPIGTWEVIEHD